MRWQDALRALIGAWDVLDKDARGKNRDWMYWMHFVWKGGVIKDSFGESA